MKIETAKSLVIAFLLGMLLSDVLGHRARAQSMTADWRVVAALDRIARAAVGSCRSYTFGTPFSCGN